jgi:oligoendopeptidase F
MQQRTLIAAAFAFLTLLGLSASATDAPATTAAATPAETQASWDLTDLYATPQAWEQSYARTHQQTEALESYRGTLGKSADSMLKALLAISDLNREIARLGIYAGLKSDEDVRISANQELNQRAQSLGTLIGAKTAWLAPEIIRLGAAKVKRFEAANKTLNDRFGFQLDDTLRAAPHTLGDEAEGVLALSGDLLAQPYTMTNQFGNGELPLPTVTLSDGTSTKLIQSNFEKYRPSANRKDRKLVFDEYFGAWTKFQGTVGNMLATKVIGDEFTAKSRKYDSALQGALFADNMPESVYKTLVAETHAALPTLHRYLRLRKRLLGITDELHYYDNYPPLFHMDHIPEFSVEDSKRITLEALKPLGEEYLGLLRTGFAGRWMNVYPHEGKSSGAYMNGGAYDVHPYLLLNHSGDYNSLSTFAHEWGHAMHTLLENKAQPYEKTNYPTFIAESASIGNEMLLNDYMVEHAATRDLKLYYLSEGVESIRTTFFRQVLFADFELAIHQEVEQGRPLSGERLSEIYCGILRNYYGEAEGVMKIDPVDCQEWEYVRHFTEYTYYVYQYATSMAGAASMTDAILKEGEPARDRFLTMLRAGGSGYGYDLYKQAGIDMATPKPYQALVARMNRLMDEIEALENQH